MFLWTGRKFPEQYEKMNLLKVEIPLLRTV
jgi:hypothetical protein